MPERSSKHCDTLTYKHRVHGFGVCAGTSLSPVGGVSVLPGRYTCGGPVTRTYHRGCTFRRKKNTGRAELLKITEEVYT